jgi:hypothetical protein
MNPNIFLPFCEKNVGVAMAGILMYSKNHHRMQSMQWSEPDIAIAIN